MEVLMEVLASLLESSGIVIYGVVILIGFFLAFSPLFIWHNVAKLRQEMRDKLSAAVDALSEQVRELRVANAHLVEIQKQCIKTMEHVCDSLDDICRNTGGSSARSVGYRGGETSR